MVEVVVFVVVVVVEVSFVVYLIVFVIFIVEVGVGRGGGVVLVVLVVFQVGNGDAVQLVQAGQGVGLLVLVGDDGAGERLPGGLPAAGREQRVAVGVEE